MLYFSELYKEKVFTQDKQYVGKVDDLLFLANETPLITKFVVKTSSGRLLYVPRQFVKKNGIGFILRSDYEEKEKKEAEYSVLYQLQDQQIVDIDGAKVIRVNDVVIHDAPDFAISGIDIGFLGIFRWIGLAKPFSWLAHTLKIHTTSDFIPWSEIDPQEVAKNRIVLKSEQEKLKKLHPEDLAEHLEHANIQNVLRSLKVMDEEMSARVIADLNVDYQREIFRRFSPQHAGEILSLIEADEAVDVLLSLENERREEIVKFIEKDKKKAILHLLHLAKTPIGHLMSTEYVTVSSNMTVKEVLERIKKESADFSELEYVYAINKDEQIVGVETLHELLLQKPDTPFYRIMNQNLILGRLTTPKEIALRRMIKYSIYCLPIVDENRKLLGVVSLQNVAEDLVGE
ncbi:MAG TPA: CBS domain-containing protein [Patescibacteria group bacterium]|nr:CBS domain-containing protein [Patescibacteria group bacterium]